MHLYLDINECIEDPGVCGVGQCVNDDGGFHCVCPEGYQALPNQSEWDNKQRQFLNIRRTHERY